MKSEFRYVALTKNGDTISSVFIGSSTEFQSLFADRNLTLLSYKEHKKKLATGKFTLDDFKNMIEELSYLMGARIPIDSSLKQMLGTVAKESQREFLETFLNRIKSGVPVSLSLKEASEQVGYPIDNLSVQIIASGEEIGELSSALNKLKERLIFTQQLSSDIKSAMTYPMFLLSLSFVMIFFVFFFIVPKFSTLFSPSEFEKLPALSKTILTFGQFLSTNAQEVMFVLGLIVVGAVFAFQSIRGKFAAIFFHLPLIGHFISLIQLSYIFNSLGIMITGGIELDRALRQSAKLATVADLRALFDNALSEIKKGHRLSDALSSSPYIPPSAISMIAVGESSARLGDVCLLLGERFSDTFQKEIKRILLLLEPAIIVLMGAMISVVVISIMLAVLSVSDIVG